ncbi:MAG TPA: prolyl oligopeptidase family serine peptidase [Sphingobacteriaceae bacterium]|nr:prolyl oligopeptidase family serine peptidase [Sphingobacteriaceae bacterium]
MLVLLFVSVAGALQLIAQEGQRYQVPPQGILELIDAPTTPSVSFTRSGKIALMYERPDFPTIADVSQPILGLAGLRLNPANTSSAVSNASTSITVRDLATGVDHKIQGLPQEARIGNTSLNPDETMLAFTHSGPTGVELWVADMKTYQARKLVTPYLNAAFGPTLSWTPDGHRLLVGFIPANRGQMPVENTVPTGPVVQENLGKAAPARTYQNLLKNEYDEQLFDYFVTSQLAYVDMQGKISNLGAPAVYRSASFSPDGQYLLVQQILRPYSYLVPAQSFPYKVSIWNAQGQEVKHLFDYALNEAANLNRDGVTTDPRMYSWRPDQPSTLTWVMALDEGDPKNEVEFRDAVYQLSAPFQGQPQELAKTELRYAGISYTDGDHALLSERWSTARTLRMTLMNIKTGEKIKVISERKTDDAYSDPGRFVTTTNTFNRGILLTDNNSRQLTVFTISNGASPEGDRPFLLKWNLISDKQDTLFKSQAPYYESPVFFDNQGELIISRESLNEAPNYYSVNLRNRNATAITNFPHPYPSLAGVKKEIVSYNRADGLNLTGTLYLPAGYNKDTDGPLPMVLWAYPREFESREAANQISGSPYRFTRLSWGSPVFWVTRGYAILDNADMPIVGGDGKEPNDTFVEQLEENSKAAINFLANQGLVDPKRVAVGGHSYGAFMTANLLAHTDLFAAGLARSGAYNRTFTPFGFQNERRTYWEALDIYTRMSPFTYAHQIKTPILLVHGMDDENSGTFPIQSERLYNAIKGHGGTARLVFLPKEFHGYRAKESILHTLWEQDQWLETYVKNRKVD